MKRLITILTLTVIALTASAQKLEVSSKMVDFGKIPMSPQTVKEITLTNKTDKPVVIKTINVDCNCTKIEWDKRPIMAGGSSKVKIIYIPMERGTFYKKVDIISTSDPIQVTIKGTVE